MAPLLAEIADLVLLELEAVDHDRGGRLGLGGVGVPDHDGEPFAIGCPHVILDVAAETRELAAFAPRAIEQPDLRVLVLAARQEREPASVRAPARRAFALFRIGGAQRARAVPARHPHGARLLVLRRIGPGHGVRDPGAVGGELGIGHVAQPEQIRDRHRAGRRGGGGRLRAEAARDERQERDEQRPDHARKAYGPCTPRANAYFSEGMNINSPVPVGVMGASGYVGQELLRLLTRHPGAAVVFATAESAAGETLDGVGLGRGDDAPLARAEIVLSALPHGVSGRYVLEVRAAGKRAVDLSSDFRLSPEAVYGLTEVTRPRLPAAELVANPGCYPTAALLALLPLAQHGLIDQSREVVIDAASGVTGAGRTPKRELLFGEVAEDFRAYGVGNDHRHLPELKATLAREGGFTGDLVFTPHLLPVKRGILETIHVPLTRAVDQASAEEIYDAVYAAEPCVTVLRGGEGGGRARHDSGDGGGGGARAGRPGEPAGGRGAALGGPRRGRVVGRGRRAPGRSPGRGRARHGGGDRTRARRPARELPARGPDAGDRADGTRFGTRGWSAAQRQRGRRGGRDRGRAARR